MLVKQISTKTVFGDKSTIQKLVLSDEKNSHFLYRIMGEIEAYMEGKGRHQRIDRETNQPVDTFWTKFAGEFMAVNAAGQEFEAAICFLPDYVTGPIKKSIDSGSVVTFGFDVYAIYSKDSATSYEFVAQPLRQGGEESKVKQMMQNMPALPNSSVAKAIADKSKK